MIVFWVDLMEPPLEQLSCEIVPEGIQRGTSDSGCSLGWNYVVSHRKQQSAVILEAVSCGSRSCEPAVGAGAVNQLWDQEL
ncbi:hypothetical protein scyTo_0019355 [Scyliorhinus torazame]|uniref:Uncharacterized protein n=1 Tax=Scyliorhinus torazame TaxID=75743 RepID=A0A401PY65_SCYTO|nr:hypothetical protein [Scyliorhinus torazame]